MNTVRYLSIVIFDMLLLGVFVLVEFVVSKLTVYFVADKIAIRTIKQIILYFFTAYILI